MTEETLRSGLESALAATSGSLLLRNYLLRGESLEKCDVFRFEFEQELTADVIEDVLQFVRRLADGELIAYDPAYQISGNQALFDDLDSLPLLASVVTEAIGDDVPLDDAAGTPVVGMIHVLRSTDTLVTVVRLKGAGIATQRARGFLALLPRDGLYSRITQEILYYEPRFDAAVIGDQVAVTASTTIQGRLGSPERARQLATTTFTSVTSKLAIDGIDALRDAATTQPNMLAKMASIARTIDADPDYLKLLTTARLADFLAANPQIDIKVEGAGDNRSLVFDPRPQNRYAILKLIADDYLHSTLSGRNYEAGSKQVQG
jgi:hypothetical protein